MIAFRSFAVKITCFILFRVKHLDILLDFNDVNAVKVLAVAATWSSANVPAINRLRLRHMSPTAGRGRGTGGADTVGILVRNKRGSSRD